MNVNLLIVILYDGSDLSGCTSIMNNTLPKNIVNYIFEFLKVNEVMTNSILSKTIFNIISSTKRYTYHYSRMKWRLKINTDVIQNCGFELEITIPDGNISEATYDVIPLWNTIDIEKFINLIGANLERLPDHVKLKYQAYHDDWQSDNERISPLIYDKSVIQVINEVDVEEYFDTLEIPLYFWSWHRTKIKKDDNIENYYVSHIIRCDIAFNDYFQFVITDQHILLKFTNAYGTIETIVKHLLGCMERIQSSMNVKERSNSKIEFYG